MLVRHLHRVTNENYFNAIKNGNKRCNGQRTQRASHRMARINVTNRLTTVTLNRNDSPLSMDKQEVRNFTWKEQKSTQMMNGENEMNGKR